jgi:hypothetical protein
MTYKIGTALFTPEEVLIPSGGFDNEKQRYILQIHPGTNIPKSENPLISP